MFKNPDLAGSLRRIAERGRDGYYTGPTAEAILAISKEQGGTFTAADLAEYQPEWVDAGEDRLPRAGPSTRSAPTPRASPR